MKNLFMLFVMFLCFSTSVKAQKLIEGKIYKYELVFPSDVTYLKNDYVLFYVRKNDINPKISFVYWDKETNIVYIKNEIIEIYDFYNDPDKRDCVNQKLIPEVFDKNQMFSVYINLIKEE